MVVEREKIDNGIYRIVADIIDDLEHNPDVSTTMEKCAYIRGVLDMKKRSLEWIDVLEDWDEKQ